jgi:hypothetical protein
MDTQINDLQIHIQSSQFQTEQEEIYSPQPATLYFNSSKGLIDDKRRIGLYSRRQTSPQPEISSVACLN